MEGGLAGSSQRPIMNQLEQRLFKMIYQFCFLKILIQSYLTVYLLLGFKQGRFVSLMYMIKLFKMEHDSVSNNRSKYTVSI